jgi:cytosine/adenosine deaminase-related metal-dependent hydrolase
LNSGQAKSRFQIDDLLDRGRELIQISIRYGVTHLRAFVGVDEVVGTKCLDAGLVLKPEYETYCHIEICAFAQDPIFSKDDGGKDMIRLLEESAARLGVDAIGSTPYVESTRTNELRNIEWLMSLALGHSLHLDFHLDYSLDLNKKPTVYHLIQKLRKVEWKTEKAVTLGHCTRLTHFNASEWRDLNAWIGELPVFLCRPSYF